MVAKKLYDDVQKRLKKYRKKYDHEVRNVFDNLGTLFDSIELGSKTEQLKKLGFVHSYKLGILSIDQSGPGKGSKMKAFRLYVYYNENDSILHILTFGDKSTQERNVSNCQNTVSKLLGPTSDEVRTG